MIHRIEWNGNALEYTCGACGSVHDTIVPTEHEWREFQNLLHHIRLMDWENQISDTPDYDQFGSKWEFEQVIDGCRIVTDSRNMSQKLFGQDLSQSLLNAVVILSKGKFTY